MSDTTSSQISEEAPVIVTPVEIPGKEVGAVLETVRDLEEKGTDIKTELKEATETVEAPETTEAESGKEPEAQVAVPVAETSVETPVEEVPTPPSEGEVPTSPSEGAPTKEDSVPEETTEIIEDSAPEEIIEDSASSVDSESFEKIEITEEPTVSEPTVSEPSPAVEVAEKVEDVPTPVVVESPPSVESVEDSSFLSRYKTPVILGSLAAIGAAAVVHLAKKKNK